MSLTADRTSTFVVSCLHHQLRYLRGHDGCHRITGRCALPRVLTFPIMANARWAVAFHYLAHCPTVPRHSTVTPTAPPGLLPPPACVPHAQPHTTRTKNCPPMHAHIWCRPCPYSARFTACGGRDTLAPLRATSAGGYTHPTATMPWLTAPLITATLFCDAAPRLAGGTRHAAIPQNARGGGHYARPARLQFPGRQTSRGTRLLPRTPTFDIWLAHGSVPFWCCPFHIPFILNIILIIPTRHYPPQAAYIPQTCCTFGHLGEQTAAGLNAIVMVQPYLGTTRPTLSPLNGRAGRACMPCQNGGPLCSAVDDTAQQTAARSASRSNGSL